MCYANAIVQALRTLHIAPTCTCHMKSCGHCIVRKCCLSVQDPSCIYTLHSKAKELMNDSHGRQQDAHEFYIKLSQFLPDSFKGDYTIHRQCIQCGNLAQDEQSSTYMSLPLKDGSGKLNKTVRESFDKYTDARQIQRLCDRCGANESVEQAVVERYPEVFAIHLNRFDYINDYQGVIKLHHPVSVPSNLTIDKDTKYELMAMINHHGQSPYSGHYTATVQCNGKWWSVDDGVTRQLENYNVTNAQSVYMLLYAKVTIPIPKPVDDIDELASAFSDWESPVKKRRQKHYVVDSTDEEENSSVPVYNMYNVLNDEDEVTSAGFSAGSRDVNEIIIISSDSDSVDSSSSVHSPFKKKRLIEKREDSCKNSSRQLFQSSDEESSTPDSSSVVENFNYMKKTSQTYEWREAMNLMLNPDPEKINHNVPMGFIGDASFIVRVHDSNDITVDGTGAWGNPSGGITYIQGNEDEIYHKTSSKKNASYILRTLLYRHTTNQSYRRKVYKLTKVENGCEMNANTHTCILQYYFEKGADTHFVNVHACHGNSKSRSPYLRTKPSIIKNIKENLKATQAPKKVYTQFTTSVETRDIRDMPRNIQQMYNIKRKSSAGSAKSSDFSEVLAMASSREFVLGMEIGITGPKCVLASPRQLSDLSAFCTNANRQILGIDPTFKVGSFYLTNSTYRHLMFKNKRTGHLALMPGPFMVHATRETGQYHYFGSKISEKLIDAVINVWGTDDELALIKGLSSTNAFKGGIRLLCMQHGADNVIARLKKDGLQEAEAKKIVVQIYGSEHGGTRKEGLVDADSVDDFDEKLATLSKDWPSSFLQWFNRYKKQDILSCMIKPVRVAAGLGSPPTKYTTNDNECFNSVLKNFLGNKKRKWEEIILDLEEFVEGHYDNLTQAIYGCGDFVFTDEYRKLQLSPTEWSKKTVEQRKSYCRRVSKIGQNISPTSTEQTFAMVNKELNKKCNRSGEKQSVRKGKNNLCATTIEKSIPLSPPQYIYTEPWHNDSPFEVVFMKEYVGAKRCAGCHIDFPRSFTVPPYDIVVLKSERYQYPNQSGSWEYTRSKTRAVFYHVNSDCIRNRHPYYVREKLKLPSNLLQAHITMIDYH